MRRVNRVREARRAAGFTQLHLAGRLGASRQTIHAIEHGRYESSVLLALRLASGLGTTIAAHFQMADDEV